MKYDVPLERLRPRDEAALNRLLEAQLPVSVERAYEDAEAAVRARMEALPSVIEVRSMVMPHLGKPVEHARRWASEHRPAVRAS